MLIAAPLVVVGGGLIALRAMAKAAIALDDLTHSHAADARAHRLGFTLRP
jgi:hypothetical protein